MKNLPVITNEIRQGIIFAMVLVIAILLLGYALAAIIQFIEEIYYDFFHDN